ncbi:MAG TPA: MFS transporter [Desulfobacteria bacterium]|nr:MFS transporter [Desulfobacteria bacterium]
MNKLAAILGRYDQAIWVRVVGTVLTTITSFAIRPFMAVYLYDKTGNIYYIGLILGLAPLMGVITNLLGGGLADKYGRKPVMVWSLLLQSLPMFGFIYATTPLQFSLISMLNGMASALFFPAANAQIADIVPENRRSEVFALMHTALNVGAAIGPMLGLLMVKISPVLAFGASGCTLLIFGFLVLFLVPETLKKRVSADSAQAQKPQRLKLREHKLLLLMTALALPITLLYAQVEANFPLYLRQNFTDYLTIFTTLMTMNGTIVVLIAVWLAKRTEHLHTPNVLLTGYFLFALVGIGYGLGPWSKTVALLFIAEIIFTLGECITFPNQNKLISLLAPDEMRGRYFSVFSLNWSIAKSIGPLLGGFIFSNFGGVTLFFSLSLLLVVSGITLYLVASKRVSLPQAQTAPVSR